MELTVGYLKKVLEKLEDDVILATLVHGNNKFEPFNYEKRLLVLKDTSIDKQWGGHTFLAINGMGSNFSGEGEQKHLEYIGVFFDDNTFKDEKI